MSTFSDVEEAISAARQAIRWDQDVDPEVVQVLLDDLVRLRAQTHGDRIQAIAGAELPFLVRVAVAHAVKATVQAWRDAGSPVDVPTLTTLFPHGAS